MPRGEQQSYVDESNLLPDPEDESADGDEKREEVEDDMPELESDSEDEGISETYLVVSKVDSEHVESFSKMKLRVASASCTRCRS